MFRRNSTDVNEKMTRETRTRFSSIFWKRALKQPAFKFAHGNDGEKPSSFALDLAEGDFSEKGTGSRRLNGMHKKSLSFLAEEEAEKEGAGGTNVLGICSISPNKHQNFDAPASRSVPPPLYIFYVVSNKLSLLF
ncbi:hypothetical protein ACFSC6_16995 [Rufibacter sediminis]|uniref:Uncharacterized protein n=1 Tax=Rufibacter sediminis TaxID=2762756 RepID=A0ABR6VT34_9BACT|nr:hypothetical protein [Rufibacter sediminis]MBC3540090.1 hypothetical protein [Rufibacter sediminis]